MADEFMNQCTKISRPANEPLNSVVGEICTLRSVGVGGGQRPRANRCRKAKIFIVYPMDPEHQWKKD